MMYEGVRLPRRRALSAGLSAAGALLAAPVLAGCSAGGLVTQLQQTIKPPTLTVFLLGGASGNGNVLQGFGKPLQAALAVAQKQVAGLGGTTFQTGNDPTSWFPLPTTLFNVGADQAARSDDPSLPMPDVVIASHTQMPNYLANRALDLQPYVKLSAPALQGVSAQALRLGEAFGFGQGTFQAALPLMRIPLMCTVAPGITAVTGGKAWTADQFLQTLDRLSLDYGRPNAPMAPVPFAFGVAEMAAVGSGGTLAVSTSTTCQATFGDGAAAQGLAMTVQWGHNAPKVPTFRNPTFTYAILMYDGQTILESGGKPIVFARNGQAPSAAGWTVAPVPVFPSRPAQPVRSIDVMVFRHTKAPSVAASLAVALLSAEAQAAFLQYSGALSIRTNQALAQLTRSIPNVQGAALIANPANDITSDDAYGPLTDQNMAARTTVQTDLLTALQAMMPASAGIWFSFDSQNGPGGPNFGRVGNATVQAGETPQQVLQAAQSAANAGKPFTG